MSYTPTEWKSGDVVTSQKLNKMEAGIAAAGGGGVLVVHAYWDAGETGATLDKTYAEIHTAIQNGPVFVYLYLPNDESSYTIEMAIAILTYDPGYQKPYIVNAAFNSEHWAFTAATENDYPHADLN